jgi:hypothetical protein
MRSTWFTTRHLKQMTHGHLLIDLGSRMILLQCACGLLIARTPVNVEDNLPFLFWSYAQAVQYSMLLLYLELSSQAQQLPGF